MATNDQENNETKPGDGSMTTREAGKLGGERVRELVEEGKQQEQKTASHSDDFGERAGQAEDESGDDES